MNPLTRHGPLARLLPLLLVFALAPVIVTQAACEKSEVRRAAVAADRIANTLDALTETKRALRAEGKIDDREELALTRGLLVAVRADRLFNERVKFYANSKTLTPTARGELRALFRDVTAALAQMTRDGTIQIGNPRAREQISRLLLAASEAAQIIEGVLNR